MLAEEACELAGAKPGRNVRATKHRALGERLREILREEPIPGYRGDRSITNAWARELGYERWFEWVPMEDLE